MKRDGQPDEAQPPNSDGLDKLVVPTGCSLSLRRFFLHTYQDLLRFIEERLDAMRRLAAAGQEDQQRALQLSDVEPMEELIGQLQQRLRFWRDCREGCG